MAKQISLTFKENERELELFNWLQSKVSKGSFIKEQLLIAMSNEKNGIQVTYTHSPHKPKEELKESSKDSIVINQNFNPNEVDEF